MTAGISAITPNPALDLSGHVQRIVPNEKNSVAHPRTDPGGNGINAARMAKRLGAKPKVYGFLGGATGEQFKLMLVSEGIDCRFTPVRGNTRTNITVTNDSDHQQTRLTFPGPAVSSLELRTLKNQISKIKSPGVCLLGGSAPNGCPPEFYSAIVDLLCKNGLGVIVDVPAPLLRFVLKSLSSKLLLIKPNLTELEELVGKRLRTDSSIAREACRLLSKSALVCVSLGERGAIFAFNGEAWRIQAPRVHAKGCVGAGDSMIGAMAFSLARSRLYHPSLVANSRTELPLLAVRLGSAAGAATAMTEGTSLGHPRLIRRLCPKVSVRKILELNKVPV